MGRESRSRETMSLGMWGVLVPVAMLRLPFLLPTVEWRCKLREPGKEAPVGTVLELLLLL